MEENKSKIKEVKIIKTCKNCGDWTCRVVGAKQLACSKWRP